MDYFDERINQKNNNFNDDQNLLFETDESESEFDAFEHHLSQYENKDDEEIFDDNESIFMDHDGRHSQDLESDYESEHQISLATSFCKNTQEQDENFLDDKFNGDLLLENFSEDKFIKCKYSEDICYHNLTDLQTKHFMANRLEIDINEQNNEHDKLQQIEERSSEDERVIERRKKHFLEFISTLPKVCTPTVCGTLSQTCQNSDFLEIETNRNYLSKIMKTNENIFSDDEHNNLNNNHENDQHKFDWSIDQLATLNPVDISFNERRFLRFKDFEADQLTQEKLTKENELFFSQETIAPSPVKQNYLRVNFTNIKQEFSTNKLIKNEIKDEGKDSGNYSADETTENNSKNNENQEFELSFADEKNIRQSNIDYEFNNRSQTYATNLKTPLRDRKSSVKNLDFKPNYLLHTSTPCTFRLNEISNANEQPVERDIEKIYSLNQVNNPSIDKRSNLQRMPLQEKNRIKQKKKLFHDLSSPNPSNEDVTLFNSSSSFNQINSSSKSFSSKSTSYSSRLDNYDEGICETSSREVTFALSNQSLMSICSNNSLTPKPKKLRSSTKSFAERLNEIELYVNNDENNSSKVNSIGQTNLINSNSVEKEDAYESTVDYQNCNSTSKWMHNLTDSNCLVIKNFNNLFNNSDSGCYMSNGSYSNSGLDTKKRALFN